MSAAKHLSHIHYAPVIIRPRAGKNPPWEPVIQLTDNIAGAVFIDPVKAREGDFTAAIAQITHPAYAAPEGISKDQLIASLKTNTAPLRTSLTEAYTTLRAQTMEALDKSPRQHYQPGQKAQLSPLALTALTYLSKDLTHADTQSQALQKELAASLTRLSPRWQKTSTAQNIPFAIYDNLHNSAGHAALVDTAGTAVFVEANIIPDPAKDRPEDRKKFARALTEEIIHIMDMRSHFSARADIKARLEAFTHTSSENDAACYNKLFNTLINRELLRSQSAESFIYHGQPQELLAQAVMFKEFVEADEIQKHQAGGIMARFSKPSPKALEEAVAARLRPILGNDMMALVTEFETMVDQRNQGPAPARPGARR